MSPHRPPHPHPHPFPPQLLPGGITGLVLAGGLGTRMGGVDKGLQPLRGMPLAQHALRRLQQQHGHWVGTTAINANRHLAAHGALGTPVWPDTLPDHPGPLAGFITGLEHCTTPWLLTVPCDTPHFPLDLAERMAQALLREGADLAMASAPDGTGQLRHQPVFCLLATHLLPSLRVFIQAGGRKVGHWASQQRAVHVPFDHPGDDPHAFFNANTLADVQALEN